MQWYRRKLLQPWLDYANLLPLAEGELTEDEKKNLRTAFMKRFAKDQSCGTLWNIAQEVGRGRRIREMEKTFVKIRGVLKALPSMPLSDDATYKIDAVETGETADLTITIGDHDGHLVCQPSSIGPFIVALLGRDAIAAFFEGPDEETPEKILSGKKPSKRGKKPAWTETRRIRSCPVFGCQRFYYAVRADAKACDEHLGLARTQRWRESKRDPEKRRQYRERAELVQRINEKKGNIKLATEKARIRAKRRKKR